MVDWFVVMHACMEAPRMKLGHLIESPEIKDAVHIAIAPVLATVKCILELPISIKGHL